MSGIAKFGTRPLRIGTVVAFCLYYAFALLAVPAVAHGRDGDGIPHRWEAKHGTNPHVHDAGMDLDDDDLKNRGEYRHGTDPRDADTDDDGFSDGEEVKVLGTDPKTADLHEEPCEDEGDEDEGDEDEDEDEDENDEDEDDEDEGDEDEDECDDAENTGTIVSYNSDTNILTIDPDALSENVTGEVTDETELEWEYADGTDSDATEADLKPGADIADYELDEDGQFDEINLQA